MSNKTSSSSSMIYFFIFIFIDVFGYAYYMALQSYVLLVEIVLGAIGCLLLTCEFGFGLIAYLSFKNFEKLHWIMMAN